MEATLTEYDRLGVVREPSGTTITGIVPTDAYPCADGRRVVIGANSDGIYRRLMLTAGRLDLADARHLATNDLRVRHREELDAAIGAWTSTLPADVVVQRLEAAGVPAGPIQSAADLVNDPHVRARGLFEELEMDGRPLRLSSPGPKLTEAPGRTDWIGGEVGEHTDEVLTGLLGVETGTLEELARAGVIQRGGETEL
ncbi:MAG: CoA transferase [Candidatus Eisenbacteria bacterium]